MHHSFSGSIALNQSQEHSFWKRNVCSQSDFSRQLDRHSAPNSEMARETLKRYFESTSSHDCSIHHRGAHDRVASSRARAKTAINGFEVAMAEGSR